jgi:hypothetical protein
MTEHRCEPQFVNEWRAGRPTKGYWRYDPCETCAVIRPVEPPGPLTPEDRARLAEIRAALIRVGPIQAKATDGLVRWDGKCGTWGHDGCLIAECGTTSHFGTRDSMAALFALLLNAAPWLIALVERTSLTVSSKGDEA